MILFGISEVPEQIGSLSSSTEALGHAVASAPSPPHDPCPGCGNNDRANHSTVTVLPQLPRWLG